MISHKKKFIFTHIPKTGGRSVQQSLKDYLEPNQRLHDTMTWDLKKCSDDYFKFMFVRNPWDLVVSYYHYMWYSDVMGWWRVGNRSKPWSFKGWMKSRHFKRPQGWKKNVCYGSYQLCWGYSCDGEFLADFIGRYENFQEDFNIVCDKIGIPKQQLPHKNKTKHKHYTEYYDDETRQIVAEKYAKDIEYFGYEFGG